MSVITYVRVVKFMIVVNAFAYTPHVGMRNMSFCD
jgi:hypothetical protein